MAVSSAAEEDADFVFDTVGAVCVDAQGARPKSCLVYCAPWLHVWHAARGVEALAALLTHLPLGMQAGWRRGCLLEGSP